MDTFNQFIIIRIDLHYNIENLTCRLHEILISTRICTCCLEAIGVELHIVLMCNSLVLTVFDSIIHEHVHNYKILLFSLTFIRYNSIGIIHRFSRLVTLLFHKWLHVRLNHQDACISHKHNDGTESVINVVSSMKTKNVLLINQNVQTVKENTPLTVKLAPKK